MPRFERLVGQAIAVGDLERAVESFERIGLPSPGDPIEADGTVAVRMALNDGGYIELISVADADAPGGAALAGFLATGEGLYRTDLTVGDLAGLHAEHSADGVGAWRLGPLVEDPAGVRSTLVFAEPAAVGGARFDLVDAGSSVVVERRTWCDRIYTHAVAVAAIGPAVEAFTSAGQPLWDRSDRADWGLDTAVFRQLSGSNIEFVSPQDASRSTASAIASFIDRRGGGHYMTVIAVADVDAVHATLDDQGVATLGPPTAAPPESPWGPVRQMWVHPKLTHGAFIEFLTPPAEPPEGASS